MKKRYTYLATLLLSTASYSHEAMKPQQNFISKMCLIHQEIERTHFNEPLFASLTEKQIGEKYEIIKKYLTREDFDQVVHAENNPLVKDNLIEILTNINLDLSPDQVKSEFIKDLVRRINHFYAVFFDEHLMDYFPKTKGLLLKSTC